jgi:hypothetical protein
MGVSGMLTGDSWVRFYCSTGELLKVEVYFVSRNQLTAVVLMNFLIGGFITFLVKINWLSFLKGW